MHVVGKTFSKLLPPSARLWRKLQCILVDLYVLTGMPFQYVEHISHETEQTCNLGLNY